MRLAVLFLLTVICGQMAFAQGADHVNGGSFQKRIEYNTTSGIIVEDEQGNSYPADILFNKTGLEKLFFGDMNAPVEYLFSPSYQDPRNIPSGIRVVKSSSSDTPYTVEVKYITNWREVIEALREKYPSKWTTSYMTRAEQESIAEQNREMHRKIEEERFDLYEIETLSFPVRDLGGMLHDKMTALIDNFKAEGSAVIGFDGSTEIFRCVVGDEMWTLSIRFTPQRRALQMSDLCRQIIEDVARGDEFDEQKYIGMLEPIEF